MARPPKEGLDYFPHDTDSVNDEKIEALRALYGNDGYAFYFILLERIYRTSDQEINVSDAETIQILSKKIGIKEEEFSQILSTALKWGCFDKEKYEKDGVLTSNGIKKRADVVLQKRRQMREKYHKEKDSVSDAETNQGTRAETPQRKVKESKEKESKENNIYKGIFDYWISFGIINHKKLTEKMRGAIKARINDGYTLDELKEAITTYGEILNSPKTWFSYKWTLEEFMKRGVYKFEDQEAAWQNFLKEGYSVEYRDRTTGESKRIAKESRGSKTSKPGYRPSEQDWENEPDAL